MLLRCFLFGLLVANGESQLSSDLSGLILDDDSFYPPLEWSDTFDWTVLRALSEKSVNTLFSPASLKLVLAILYEASSGATQQDFENALHYFSKGTLRNQTKDIIDALHFDSTTNNRLSLSTNIFLDSELKPKESYAKRIKEYYDTDITAANFSDSEATSLKINLWVEKSTQGALKKLTDPDEIQDMTMLLANAVYFKGTWKYQFPKNATCIGGFFVNPETKIFIPYMTTTNIFYYYESLILDARILRLPYKGSKFSMFFILPFAKGGLPTLLKSINLMNLHRELHYLDKRPVLVSIPKFSFKLKASYKDLLQQMGLKKIFQNSASFTGMVEGNSSILRQLVVSDILQSTGIDVDEEGSIAFAATDVIIGNKIGVPDRVFNASHPFLFFIQDDLNGKILFLGKVENPLYQELEIRKQVNDIEKEFLTPNAVPGHLNQTKTK